MPSLKGFDPKHPLASKTVWVNLLTALIAVFAAMQGQEFIEDNPLLMAGLVFLLAVLNAGLRFVTDAPIGFKAVLWGAVIIFAGCTSASAGDVAVIVANSTPGNYLLTIDASGNVALSPLDRVVRVTPVPTPSPTPPPTPTPLTDRAIQIRDGAAKVTGDSDRATTAHGLAELYRQVAALVRQGKVPDLPTLQIAVKMATDNFLASRGQGAATAWQPVRDVFSNQWTLVTARSNPAPTLLDFASLIEEAAAGLDASAPASGGESALPPGVLAIILQIVQLVIQLLQQQHP